MKRKSSPHAVLGLVPGASRDEVDAAYRRLIKQHHPDLPGGDAEAAQAIIAAYRSLARGEVAASVPVVVEAPAAAFTARRRWKRLTAAVIGAGVLWWAPWPTFDIGEKAPGFVHSSSGDGTQRQVPALLLPRVAPDSAAVEAGVDEALRLFRQAPSLARSYGRSCAGDLRRLPGDGLLDHCLAFDMTMSRLSGNWNDSGMPSSHAEAAIAVLDDPVLAEARVLAIRQQVERRLAPAE